MISGLIDYEKINNPVTFTLEYQSGRKTYCEAFTIDLKAGVDLPTPKTATKDKELKTISYALQEMLQKNL